jgi:zinc transporter ZupT
MIPFTILLAFLMAGVHLAAGKLRFLEVIPRSRLLSMAGGASVAYVFVHILPELKKGQVVINQATPEPVLFLEHHVYLVALLGFAAFYGLERMAVLSRRKNAVEKKEDFTSPEVFWIHILSYATYNGLIGYLLLHLEEPGALNRILFFLSMGLHFFVNDYGLRRHHKTAYDRIGRWVLSIFVFLGWMVGYLTEIHRAAIAVLFAFLAGGIILNVIKEELPEERESRFWAFALGALVYTLVLLAA